MPIPSKAPMPQGMHPRSQEAHAERMARGPVKGKMPQGIHPRSQEAKSIFGGPHEGAHHGQIGRQGPRAEERTTKPQAQRLSEHRANMQKLGAILEARKNHRAPEHHPQHGHDGKAAAHPHAMMHGPKGGSFYVGPGGTKIYGNK